MKGLTSRLGKAGWLAGTVLRWTEVRLPSAGVGCRVPAVLSRLGLAFCKGVTSELVLRATLTFRKSLCSLVSVVVCEVHVGVGFGTVEESGVVVNGVAMVA